VNVNAYWDLYLPPLAQNVLKFSGITNATALAQGVHTFNPPNFVESTAGPLVCSVGTAVASYNMFNLTFTADNATIWSIVAQGFDSSFRSTLQIVVYSNFNPTAPCTGLYSSGQVQRAISGSVLVGGVNFVPGTYTVIVSGSDATYGIWASTFMAADAVKTVSAAGPYWGVVFGDSETACGETNAIHNIPFQTYQFTVDTDAYYDVEALFVNDTVSTWGDVTLALYNSSLPANLTQFGESSCLPSFVVAAKPYSGDKAGSLQYVSLKAGVNYTVVVSLDDDEYLGIVGIRVIPTQVKFFVTTPPLYSQPSRSAGACTDGGTPSAYSVTIVTAEYNVYIVDTADPAEIDSVDTYSFMYLGLNQATATAAPSTCPLGRPLIVYGDTGDITPVAAQTLTGHNYTVIVSTYSAGYTVQPTQAFILYTLTGPLVNIPGGLIQTTTSVVTTTTGKGTTGSAPIVAIPCMFVVVLLVVVSAFL